MQSVIVLYKYMYVVLKESNLNHFKISEQKIFVCDVSVWENNTIYWHMYGLQL